MESDRGVLSVTRIIVDSALATKGTAYQRMATVQCLPADPSQHSNLQKTAGYSVKVVGSGE